MVAAIIVGWALASSALPGLGVLPSLDTVDWSWPYRHQNVTAIVIAVLIVGGVITLLLTQERIEAFWSRVRQGFAILTQPRRYLLGVVTWQLLSWACRLASVYWFLKAFHMPATMHDAFVVLSVQSISTLLPITPGGVGTVQGLLVATFRNKIATATVLSFSVGMHVATVVTNLVVGFTAIGLMLKTFRWKRVVQPEKPLAEH